MAQFRERLPFLKQIDKLAYSQIQKAITKQGIYVTGIEHRVKNEKSLEGKVELKGAKYNSIDDITDLVGIRIITFYTDDVDKVAAIAKQIFDVDWKESVDKRKAHELTSFGYNSLHYICRLRTDDPQLSNIRFELQMRTALQHVWSTIEHDTGYKGTIKISNDFRRQFGRLAGMLELIDDEFSRLRTSITEYRRQIQSLVQSGKLSEVALSTDTFKSFLELHPFDKLNQRIAAVNQAEVYPTSLMLFLPVLEDFGFETLADVHHFIEENADDAYQMAISQIALTDLDILSESVGLQSLCLTHVLKQGKGREGIKRIFDLINGEQPINEDMADMIWEQVKALPFVK